MGKFTQVRAEFARGELRRGLVSLSSYLLEHDDEMAGMRHRALLALLEVTEQATDEQMICIVDYLRKEVNK